MRKVTFEALHTNTWGYQSTLPIEPVQLQPTYTFAAIMSRHQLTSRRIADQLAGWQVISNPRALVLKAIENKVPIKQSEMTALVCAVNRCKGTSYTLADIGFLTELS